MNTAHRPPPSPTPPHPTQSIPVTRPLQARLPHFLSTRHLHHIILISASSSDAMSNPPLHTKTDPRGIIFFIHHRGSQITLDLKKKPSTRELISLSVGHRVIREALNASSHHASPCRLDAYGLCLRYRTYDLPLDMLLPLNSWPAEPILKLYHRVPSIFNDREWFTEARRDWVVDKKHQLQEECCGHLRVR